MDSLADLETTFRNELRRISVRLSEAAMQLPEGMYLSGVYLEDPTSVAFGAYANVHVGLYEGQRVALKTIRNSKNADDLPRKAVKVLCSFIVPSSSS